MPGVGGRRKLRRLYHDFKPPARAALETRPRIDFGMDSSRLGTDGCSRLYPPWQRFKRGTS